MISQEFNIEEANEKQQKQKTTSRKKYSIFFSRDIQIQILGQTQCSLAVKS